MAYTYTSDELIAQVKRRGMIPSSDNTLATADFLSFINDEIQTYVVPFVMSTREEFFVTEEDQAISAATAEYPIPTRAIGSKMRHVLVSNGGDFTPLPRLEPEAVAGIPSNAAGQPEGYYIKGNDVVLHPTPSAASTLRLSYFARPNRCVSLSDTGTVSSTTSTTIVLTSTAPATFATGGATYDIIKGTPHFECRYVDRSATRSSLTLTFSSVGTDVVAGDYVAIRGETPVPQIPVELHPLLAARVVVRALEALGDPKAEIAAATAERMRLSATTLLTPRSEGSSRYVINYNAPGWRTGRRRGGW